MTMRESMFVCVGGRLKMTYWESGPVAVRQCVGISKLKMMPYDHVDETSQSIKVKVSEALPAASRGANSVNGPMGWSWRKW